MPGVAEFDAQIESDLLDISEEQLNEKFAQCSQLQTSDLGQLFLIDLRPSSYNVFLEDLAIYLTFFALKFIPLREVKR